jgi:serine/threonine protein kinase
LQLREEAVVAERFRLIRELGRGAMGTVWLAHHVALQVPCAVKFMHGKALDRPMARERFEREAKAAATLRGANVVQILDYGVWESVPYLAMEYLEGETLSARLERRGRLGPEETVRLATQLGRALAKAHKLGIVHRDLKPENIFLVRDDDQEVAKVLDFGVAKDTGGLGPAAGSTRTGVLLGTPVYMSPEQARGAKEVDWRTDLWALGVILYRCVVGELPFYDEQLVDLLLMICTGPLPVPSQHAAEVPAAFDRWWEQAAQREPDRRFQSAKALVEALAAALGVTGVIGQSAPDDELAPTRRAPAPEPAASYPEPLPAVAHAATAPDPRPSSPWGAVAAAPSSPGAAPSSAEASSGPAMLAAASPAPACWPLVPGASTRVGPGRPQARGRIAIGALAVLLVLAGGAAAVALRVGAGPWGAARSSGSAAGEDRRAESDTVSPTSTTSGIASPLGPGTAAPEPSATSAASGAAAGASSTPGAGLDAGTMVHGPSGSGRPAASTTATASRGHPGATAGTAQTAVPTDRVGF